MHSSSCTTHSVRKEYFDEMSFYVRKTAALAISKLLGLDQEQREETISFIKTLLKVRTTHVVGQDSVSRFCKDICTKIIIVEGVVAK